MANGDKPPGGVLVHVTSPNTNESISITCHSVEDADKVAQEVVEECRKIAKKYK